MNLYGSYMIYEQSNNMCKLDYHVQQVLMNSSCSSPDENPWQAFPENLKKPTTLLTRNNHQNRSPATIPVTNMNQSQCSSGGSRNNLTSQPPGWAAFQFFQIRSCPFFYFEKWVTEYFRLQIFRQSINRLSYLDSVVLIQQNSGDSWKTFWLHIIHRCTST